MIKKFLLAGTALALVFGFAPARAAGIDLNEVSSFLVFPGVAAITSRPSIVETFLTFTNTSSTPYIAHVAFINGDENDPEYCFECDFDVPMSGFDTETLVLTRDHVNDVTHILNLDTGASRTCFQWIGFVTVNLEDSGHLVRQDNVLLGEEVVVDYTGGTALSVPAISIQGEVGANTDRVFEFGSEYRSFPSRLGGDFLAPDFNPRLLQAYLVIFTLAFEKEVPPLVHCGVNGFDAFEEQISNSFVVFGCWTIRALEQIDPEFAYPFLGAFFEEQEHGWFYLSCEVEGTGDKNPDPITGGVHGLIAQYARTGADLRRNAPSPTFTGGNAAWARILYQSGLLGGDLAYELGPPYTGGF